MRRFAHKASSKPRNASIESLSVQTSVRPCKPSFKLVSREITSFISFMC